MDNTTSNLEEFNTPLKHPGINPLIEEGRTATISNVHNVLATAQELTIAPLTGELVLNQAATAGLLLILDTIREALALVLAQDGD